MADLRKIVTSIGPVKRHVRLAYEEIVGALSLQPYFGWGAPGRGTGDHAQGLAVDIMTYELGGGVNRPGPLRYPLGNQTAAYVLKHRKRLGISYLIWNRRIASDLSDPAWSWRRYTGSNPHIDHNHISFEANHTYKPPQATDEDDDMALSDADIKKIVDGVWDKQLQGGTGGAPYPTAAGWLAGGMPKWDRQRAEMKLVLQNQVKILQQVGAAQADIDLIEQHLAELADDEDPPTG